MLFRELHDDTERLLRVEEQLLPVRRVVVVADDLVAEAADALRRHGDVRHLERDVMHARPACREEAVHEAAGLPERLDQLEALAVGERPLGAR
jgi:hypothetical protein